MHTAALFLVYFVQRWSNTPLSISPIPHFVTLRGFSRHNCIAGVSNFNFTVTPFKHILCNLYLHFSVCNFHTCNVYAHIMLKMPQVHLNRFSEALLLLVIIQFNEPQLK